MFDSSSSADLEHRWYSQPIRHRRTAAVAGSKAGRACVCACAGRVQRQAGSGRTGEAGCCVADVEGSIGAAEAAAAACPTAQSGASCACVPCGSVHIIGREGAAAVASRLVGLVGLVDVLWRGSRHSPSRRPEQRYQLQGPFRVHLCGGGVIKATDGGGNGARAASGAWERAHRHRCLKICLHDLGRRPTSSRSPSLHAAS